jgi:hypothetical protein
MVKAKVIVISEAEANGTEVSIPEYDGYDLLILRGGFPMASNKYTSRPGGGFQLITPGDKVLLGETFAVFGLPAASADGVAAVYNVSQYPHRLIAMQYESEAVQDENGDWVPQNSSLIDQACRAEPNSKGGFIPVADGKSYLFEWVVYLPLPVTELKLGTKVTIEWNGQEFGKGTVQRFSRGQLNARIWL